METLLDIEVKKASDVMCPDECHIYTCPMNAAIFNITEHIRKGNLFMIFGYWRLFHKYGSLTNPPEAH